MLSNNFFNQDPLTVAQALLGKVLRHKVDGIWFSAMIIETEAYYQCEKGSHASLGYTEKRRALFMPPGTIYMYYARGGDSLNFSCAGKGNAVLIKSGFVHQDSNSPPDLLQRMQANNPVGSTKRLRPENRLCAGQTLLCKSLGLKVPLWDQHTLQSGQLELIDTGYQLQQIIQTTRLGIPRGRDEHLPYRFIDYQYAAHSTSNPLTKRGWRVGREYVVIPAIVT